MYSKGQRLWVQFFFSGYIPSDELFLSEMHLVGSQNQKWALPDSICLLVSSLGIRSCLQGLPNWFRDTALDTKNWIKLRKGFMLWSRFSLKGIAFFVLILSLTPHPPPFFSVCKQLLKGIIIIYPLVVFCKTHTMYWISLTEKSVNSLVQ